MRRQAHLLLMQAGLLLCLLLRLRLHLLLLLLLLLLLRHVQLGELLLQLRLQLQHALPALLALQLTGGHCALRLPLQPGGHAPTPASAAAAAATPCQCCRF